MNEDRSYSIFEKIRQYIRFLALAKNRHSVHSPFVFDFIENVLRKNYTDVEVELLRKELLNDKTMINIKDYGTGKDRVISTSNFAKNSLKKRKEAQLIARITKYFDFKRVLELGTSLGVTSAYIARTNTNLRLITIEGSGAVLERAKELWTDLNIKNIIAFNGSFDSILPNLLDETEEKTLFFIDGNHSYSATLEYFNRISENIHPNSILLIDDIYWSSGMKDAWKEMCMNEKVSLSIDLFEMGHAVRING